MPRYANPQPAPYDAHRLRARLAAAAERIIAALDALDAPTEDLEDGYDAEDDPAENGIADYDGYIEQTVGEPSLGSTGDMDQQIAWGADRASFITDGEASGTEDDVVSHKTVDAWKADRAARDKTNADVRLILQRRREG